MIEAPQWFVARLQQAFGASLSVRWEFYPPLHTISPPVGHAVKRWLDDSLNVWHEVIPHPHEAPDAPYRPYQPAAACAPLGRFAIYQRTYHTNKVEHLMDLTDETGAAWPFDESVIAALKRRELPADKVAHELLDGVDRYSEETLAAQKASIEERGADVAGWLHGQLYGGAPLSMHSKATEKSWSFTTVDKRRFAGEAAGA